MPTYEYLCQKCKKTWEIEQKITDSPVNKCPYCESHKTQRQISNNYFVLKGEGWSKDGY